MALVPTTLSGNKWLFNISMHTKRQRKNERWWIKQKEATRKGRGFSIISNERASEREEICGVSNKTSSFYLMGAEAVMHPRGPHVNNWTDIGAAPAGSPNHRRSFEQTAVTLRHQAWQRSAAKHRREEGGGRREGRGEKKKKKDAFEAVNVARGYGVMSTSPRRLHGFTIWKLFLVLINPKCVIYWWKTNNKAADIPSACVVFCKMIEITPSETFPQV